MRGRIATLGVTTYILKRLDALINLDLPQVGDEVLTGVTFGEVESLSGISDLTCPVEGTVIKNNKHLPEGLDTLSRDPYGEGWLIKVRVVDLEQINPMMTAEEYKKYTKNGA
jgi:glycine cleavage system H protein